MEKIAMKVLPARHYKNNGQHAEQVFRYTMCGKIVAADNRPACLCGDYEDIQIKSSRATVCNGNDLVAGLASDAAKRYAYVTADFQTAYIMTKAEWIAFVARFSTMDIDSKKTATKIRLKKENKQMLAWLATR